MTSIHRPWRSAIARASSARTSGETSLAARLDSPRGIGTLADDHAALAGRLDDRPVAAGRRGSAHRAWVVPTRPLRDRSTWGRTGLRPRPSRAIRPPRRRRRRCLADERVQPHGQAANHATPEQRTADAPTRTTTSRSILAASPAPTLTRRPAGEKLTRGGERRRIALPGNLLEPGELPDLATSASVELVRRAFEGRVADDRVSEDVGLDVPWLIGDHAKLHGGEFLPEVRRRCLSRRFSDTSHQCSVQKWARALRPRPTRWTAPVTRSGRRTGLGFGERVSHLAAYYSMAMTAPFIPAPADVRHDHGEAGVSARRRSWPCAPR